MTGQEKPKRRIPAWVDFVGIFAEPATGQEKPKRRIPAWVDFVGIFNVIGWWVIYLAGRGAGHENDAAGVGFVGIFNVIGWWVIYDAGRRAGQEDDDTDWEEPDVRIFWWKVLFFFLIIAVSAALLGPRFPLLATGLIIYAVVDSSRLTYRHGFHVGQQKVRKGAVDEEAEKGVGWWPEE